MHKRTKAAEGSKRIGNKCDTERRNLKYTYDSFRTSDFRVEHDGSYGLPKSGNSLPGESFRVVALVSEHNRETIRQLQKTQ